MDRTAGRAQVPGRPGRPERGRGAGVVGWCWCWCWCCQRGWRGWRIGRGRFVAGVSGPPGRVPGGPGVDGCRGALGDLRRTGPRFRTRVAGVTEATDALGGVGAGCAAGGVDAAAHPDGTAGLHLVAHRVGQCLDAVVAGDLVAVVVEPGVQVREAQRAVALEDGQARSAQGSTRHGPGLGRNRRERGPSDRRGPPALAVRYQRPELVADDVHLAQCLESLAGGGVDGRLEPIGGVQQLVPPDLQRESAGCGQIGLPAVPEQAATGHGKRRGPSWSCPTGQGVVAARHRVASSQRVVHRATGKRVAADHRRPTSALESEPTEGL